MLTDIGFPTGNLRFFLYFGKNSVYIIFLIDFHSFHKFKDERIILCQQCIEEVFFTDFLISILLRKALQAPDCLYGFLGKFRSIHNHTTFLWV